MSQIDGNKKILLASASPRRRELLEQIGVKFELMPVDIPEEKGENESPEHYVRRLALEKAKAGWSRQLLVKESKTAVDAIDVERRDHPSLGADTIVVLGETVLEKPVNKEDALYMLSILSSQRHTVMTAVAMTNGKLEKVLLNQTKVYFRSLSASEIEAYWKTGESIDKAGAYGIQGFGGVFVEKIEGSYSGVMGLPLWETCQLLTEFKVPYWGSV